MTLFINMEDSKMVVTLYQALLRLLQTRSKEPVTPQMVATLAILVAEYAQRQVRTKASTKLLENKE